MTRQQLLKEIEGNMSEEMFKEKMTNVKILSKQQCWTMVNRVNDFQKFRIAQVWLAKAVDEKTISNLEYDDLMMALSYISRELHHEKQLVMYDR